MTGLVAEFQALERADRLHRSLGGGEVDGARGLLSNRGGTNLHFIGPPFLGAWGVDDEMDLVVLEHVGHVGAGLPLCFHALEVPCILIEGQTIYRAKDYGHTCYMPERITIDKLRIEDTNPPDGHNGPVVLGNFNPAYKDVSFVEKFPYIRTREVIVKAVTTASGKPLRLSDNPVMFREVVAKGLGGKQ